MNYGALLLIFFTSISYAQERITLKQVDEVDVVYETPKALIHFHKADLINAFEAERHQAWFTSKDLTAKNSIENVIDLLKEEESRLHFQEDLKPKLAYHEVLRKIIKDRLGATILLAGDASVVNKQTTKEIKEIEFKTRLSSSSTGLPYEFFFVGDDNFFFAGEISGAKITEETSSMIEAEIIVAPGDTYAETFSAADVNYDLVYVVVEQLPEYPGGAEKLDEYLKKKLKYPKKAGERIQGKVYVQFVVERDGTLTDIKTVKGLCDKCDKEAERVVRKSGKWKPGRRQNGKTVRVKYTLPVPFLKP